MKLLHYVHMHNHDIVLIELVHVNSRTDQVYPNQPLPTPSASHRLTHTCSHEHNYSQLCPTLKRSQLATLVQHSVF